MYGAAQQDKSDEYKSSKKNTSCNSMLISIGNAAGLRSLGLTVDKMNAAVQRKSGIPADTVVSYKKDGRYVWGRVVREEAGSYTVRRLKLIKQGDMYTEELGEAEEIGVDEVTPVNSLEFESIRIKTSIFREGILSPKGLKSLGSPQETFTQDALSSNHDEYDFIHVNFFWKPSDDKTDELVEKLIYDSAHGAIPVALENCRDARIADLFSEQLPNMDVFEAASQIGVDIMSRDPSIIKRINEEMDRRSRIQCDVLKNILEERIHKTIFIIASAPSTGESYDGGDIPDHSGSEQEIRKGIEPSSFKYVLCPQQVYIENDTMATVMAVGDTSKIIPLKFGMDVDSDYHMELSIPDYASSLRGIIQELDSQNYITHIVRL